MRVAISGGGTGGHIFPALALCESLRRLDATGELLYIGGASGMETTIVPAAGVPFRAVTARKLRKLISLSTPGVAWSLLRGYREAVALLRAFRPDVVVGTGGYVAAAAVLAGARLGIPTLILAPDRIPGRTNLLLARLVKKICLVFEETAARFPTGRSVVTGLPLRAGTVAPAELTPEAARCRFTGLAADRLKVLIVGGSQGARALNDAVLSCAAGLLDSGVQLLHQIGPKNLEQVEARARELGVLGREGYCGVGFLSPEQVPAALRAADLIVCRGGISTLSEALANGLPAVVVPLPTAYADHQTVNARALEAAGAAELLPQSELTPKRLAETILGLKADSARRASMADASRRMGRPRAADEIAALVLTMKTGTP